MGRLLCREDLEFFKDSPKVAAQFRRERFHVFLAYLRDLHQEIACYHQESSRLMARGAWNIAKPAFEQRAVLLYHHARLLKAALCYRWLPMDVTPTVQESLGAVLARISPVPVTD